MGVCFSKKKNPAAPPPSNEPNISEKNNAVTAATMKEETRAQVKSPLREASPIEKKRVFVIAQSPKKTPSSTSASNSSGEEAKKKEKADVKNAADGGNVAVRTSSCTKEELDAILIQCGRLSRSSSGNAGAEAGAGNRRYSGSKRSYDFDNEKSAREEDEEWDQRQISRPSPRRRTPNRERSGSRERASQRKVSRSPGRRSDGPAGSSSSAGCEKPKQQQPAKMVSVPARDKGVTHPNAASFAAPAAVESAGAKRATNSAANRRNASPRSRSPANASRVSNENVVVVHQPAQPQSLSRSSSRKAEHSPLRRNPMAEIDDNLIRGNQGSSNNKIQKSKEGDEIVKKASQIQNQRNGMNNATTTSISNCVRDQLMSCRPKEMQLEPEIVEAKDPKGAAKVTEIETLNHPAITRSRSARRSSRDLDHILGLNPDANNPNAFNYASLLLDDIQNYHQQNAGFSLPSCLSKACCILEAVADLTSSTSDQSNNDNVRFARRGLANKEPFVESEIVVKDDLMEPSLHKYVSVRDPVGEMEPQESAGSNSFVGAQAWLSALDLNSVDSTDRHWTSQANNGDDVEEMSLPEAARGSRFRNGGSRQQSAAASSSKKRDLGHHQLQRGGSGVGGVNGKDGGRIYSVPVVAASATS